MEKQFKLKNPLNIVEEKQFAASKNKKLNNFESSFGQEKMGTWFDTKLRNLMGVYLKKIEI